MGCNFSNDNQWEKILGENYENKKKKMIILIKENNKYEINCEDYILGDYYLDKLKNLSLEYYNKDKNFFSENYNKLEFNDLISNFGILQNFRINTWKNILDIKKEFHHEYLNLIDLSSNKNDINQINKDIIRTDNKLKLFKTDICNFYLYKLCKSVSTYILKVGYTQGMNFICKFLLEITSFNDILSFLIFKKLLLDEKYYFVGLYYPGFPLVKFLIFCVEEILKMKDKKIYETITENKEFNFWWSTKWFICLFTTVLPRYHTVRFFDYIICNNIFSLCYLTVGIIITVKKHLINLDYVELIKMFQNIKSIIKIYNPSDIIIISNLVKLDKDQLFNIYKNYKKELSKEDLINFSKIKKIIKKNIK